MPRLLVDEVEQVDCQVLETRWKEGLSFLGQFVFIGGTSPGLADHTRINQPFLLQGSQVATDCHGSDAEDLAQISYCQLTLALQVQQNRLLRSFRDFSNRLRDHRC